MCLDRREESRIPRSTFPLVAVNEKPVPAMVEDEVLVVLHSIPSPAQTSTDSFLATPITEKRKSRIPSSSVWEWHLKPTSLDRGRCRFSSTSLR